VIRIEISTAAAALAASATHGLLEPHRSPEGGYFIWLAQSRGAIIRLAREEVAT